jgi:hypothetical protein
LKSILVSPQGVTLEIGKNQAFTAQGKDQSNNNMNVIAIWSSSNTAVGTIDSRGIFTARGAGMTTITALSSFVKGTASVTVKAPPVLKTIIITPQNKTLEVGKTMQYNAEGKDQYNNRMNASMSWSVSDTRVG